MCRRALVIVIIRSTAAATAVVFARGRSTLNGGHVECPLLLAMGNYRPRNTLTTILMDGHTTAAGRRKACNRRRKKGELGVNNMQLRTEVVLVI